MACGGWSGNENRVDRVASLHEQTGGQVPMVRFFLDTEKGSVFLPWWWWCWNSGG